MSLDVSNLNIDMEREEAQFRSSRIYVVRVWRLRRVLITDPINCANVRGVIEM